MANLTKITTDAKIFLTDYASYNNGTQFEFGHWVDLDQFNDADELNEYITQHFTEADEKSPLDDCGSTREEIMITDFEGFPEEFYSESGCDFDKIFAYIEIKDDLENADWVNLHNQFCENAERSDDEFYENDEEFLQMFFSDRLDELARAIFYGDYRYMDEYIRFNGYGNLETFDKYQAEQEIDKDEILNDILENRQNYHF
jgi:hypothetical protein